MIKRLKAERETARSTVQRVDFVTVEAVSRLFLVTKRAGKSSVKFSGGSGESRKLTDSCAQPARSHPTGRLVATGSMPDRLTRDGAELVFPLLTRTNCLRKNQEDDSDSLRLPVASKSGLDAALFYRFLMVLVQSIPNSNCSLAAFISER